MVFKINKLELCNYADEIYTYNFSQGINYFKGKNSTGKTEFYNFIDYMFGSSEDIRKKQWFKDSLKKASMEVQVENVKYKMTRFSDPSKNLLSYADEKESEIIDKREYKERLNAIFATNEVFLRSIRKFTEEELTFRTFTMFNFLGEQHQGIIHDFLDKCSDIKYSIKLAPILNFIFNNNLEKIYTLQQELERLQEKLRELEDNCSWHNFICDQINQNMQKLGVDTWYTGNNAEDIYKALDAIKNMQAPVQKNKRRNIADLEIMYSNISDQIKVYENTIEDVKQFERNSKNRRILLENLDNMLKENAEFGYLIEPVKELMDGLDDIISFGQYTISDKTIKVLKKQRQALKLEIRRNDSAFQCYTIEEKTKALTLIEEYLSVDTYDHSGELKRTQKRIRKIKEKIKVLQNSDDETKINEFSKYITKLYKSAGDVSSIINEDTFQEGFQIKYLKRGNALQPMGKSVKVYNDAAREKEDMYLYIGSYARRALIKLCGYIGFLKILLKENNYPIIPILVIDHISKSFDTKNVRAVGQIINTAIKDIGEENLQIFMFDDKEYETLALAPNHFENLSGESKTGFNPFYCPESILKRKLDKTVTEIKYKLINTINGLKGVIGERQEQTNNLWNFYSTMQTVPGRGHQVSNDSQIMRNEVSQYSYIEKTSSGLLIRLDGTEFDVSNLHLIYIVDDVSTSFSFVYNKDLECYDVVIEGEIPIGAEIQIVEVSNEDR